MINNTLKHADAKSIKINLTYKNSVVDLLYDDNGKGFNFDQDKIQESTGMGLRNMISRLDSIHAYYELESNPGKGFHAYLSIKI